MADVAKIYNYIRELYWPKSFFDSSNIIPSSIVSLFLYEILHFGVCLDGQKELLVQVLFIFFSNWFIGSSLYNTAILLCFGGCVRKILTLMMISEIVVLILLLYIPIYFFMEESSYIFVLTVTFIIIYYFIMIYALREFILITYNKFLRVLIKLTIIVCLVSIPLFLVGAYDFIVYSAKELNSFDEQQYNNIVIVLHRGWNIFFRSGSENEKFIFALLGALGVIATPDIINDYKNRGRKVAVLKNMF